MSYTKLDKPFRLVAPRNKFRITMLLVVLITFALFFSNNQTSTPRPLSVPGTKDLLHPPTNPPPPSPPPSPPPKSKSGVKQQRTPHNQIRPIKTTITKIPYNQNLLLSASSNSYNYNEQTIHRVSTPGAILLGMHRSGTSLLAGLLCSAMNYDCGPDKNMMQPSFDNERGFYEMLNPVWQNDKLMAVQKVDYANRVMHYSSEQSWDDIKSNKVDFDNGLRAINNIGELDGWIQKDPRMCITLKSWLPFFSTAPTIIFTYRHPLEVANSLYSRDKKNFPVTRGLRFWILYNRLALQNSEGLCTVYTKAVKIYENTIDELERIGIELEKCGVIVELGVNEEVVREFVDPGLKHNSAALEINSDPNSKCDINLGWKSANIVNPAEAKREEKLFQQAMKIFCALEDGFNDGDVTGEIYLEPNSYDWPEL